MMPERPTLDHVFVTPEEADRGFFILGGDELFHLARVKRARAGEELTWSDGASRAGRAVIDELRPGRMVLRILESHGISRALPRIDLFQALPKGGKMDDIVRRNVEVGVDGITPFVSSRSIPRPVGGGRSERQERWRKIAAEASRQCRRSYPPEVGDLADWRDCPGMAGGYDVALVAWEEEGRRRVSQALPAEAPGSVALFVGPEGGFEAGEVRDLEEAGAVPVSLGENILRTENAGLVMAVLVKSCYGHL